MKRLLALVLSLCFLLGGCAQNETIQPGKKGGAEPTQDIEVPAGTTFERLALRLSELPELPQEPDESALWDAMNGLSGEEQSKLWEEFNAQQNAYRDALQALRGEGVDATLTPSMAKYTLSTARQLFGNETEKNVVYSPANLYLALCMLSETTDGESRAQVLNLLGLENVEQARSAANALWRNLYRDSSTGKTLLANSLWLNQQFDCHEDTVDTLVKDHYASIFRAPMGEKPTDEAIRAWINENTKHLLENAANGLETDPDTLMLLISTLYFKGTWVNQFEQWQTNEDIFTAANGDEQKIDFMHQIKNGDYYRLGHYTAAALPFTDGTTMWFLLPDAGTSLDDIWTLTWNLPMLAVDTSEGCYEIPDFASLAQEGHGEIHWSVPRFDVDSDLDLIPALQSLGVTDIFDDRADFSPLTDLDALVSAVKHAARVKVDEEGCEAAAFTAIMAQATSALIEPLPVVEMNLNRPFGFLITGVDGLPLFVGAVNTME